MQRWSCYFFGRSASRGSCRHIKNPAALVDVRRGLEGLLSLPPPGGNGLGFYNTIHTHETDASVVSAAIKCQAEVAGTASSGHAAIWNFCCRPDRVCGHRLSGDAGSEKDA
jgi:hypothetical protein